MVLCYIDADIPDATFLPPTYLWKNYCDYYDAN